MFCFQCQETAMNKGCTRVGVCGKQPGTAVLQDLLIQVSRGLGLVWEHHPDERAGALVLDALFATITNANFDESRIRELIDRVVALRDSMRQGCAACAELDHPSVTWAPREGEDWVLAGEKVGVLATENEDVRSLRELLVYGLKGIAAYAHHALILGKRQSDIEDFLLRALASTTRDLSVEEMVSWEMRACEMAVATMALLDAGNPSRYGHPEITRVKTGVGNRPGILISGHDLLDLEELLEQTAGKGIDVYTHSEMLPGHYYPAFRKYPHFYGNYGGSWWHQGTEFASFNGPILMTTNCIIPVREAYRDRIFTTGLAGYPGVPHIADREPGKSKDFSALIRLAQTCSPPQALEDGEIVGGFAHHQVLSLADKVIEAVKSGAIKRFVVMAGCDGRMKDRQYFTDVAEALPPETIILTAGCAKYRYNKLNLGDIGGIPRVLDAGQCNDSYSLAVIALKLKEAFGLADVNDLPLSFDIAWYEQKAVAVLLALLHLGFKKIRLGPTLPAFVSPGVLKVLVEQFQIMPTSTVEEDVRGMMSGS